MLCRHDVIPHHCYECVPHSSSRSWCDLAQKYAADEYPHNTRNAVSRDRRNNFERNREPRLAARESGDSRGRARNSHRAARSRSRSRAQSRALRREEKRARKCRATAARPRAIRCDQMRFTHSAVYETFSHGSHENTPLEKLIKELTQNPASANALEMYAARFEPCEHQTLFIVCSGNRRLECMRRAAVSTVDVSLVPLRFINGYGCTSTNRGTEVVVSTADAQRAHDSVRTRIAQCGTKRERRTLKDKMLLKFLDSLASSCMKCYCTGSS